MVAAAPWARVNTSVIPHLPRVTRRVSRSVSCALPWLTSPYERGAS